MDEDIVRKPPMSLRSPLNIGYDIESPDEEDEDVDFNPSLKEALSPEASSSLSSEIEERDIEGDVTEYETGTLHNEDDEINPQGLEIKGGQSLEYQKTAASVSRADIEYMGDHEMVLSSGTDVLHYETAEKLGTREDRRNPVFDFDDDGDAICKRTRARYSLVSFTLDELETFLQETDDDDDLPNVDDEEEYQKFLAAVLLGGDGDGKGDQENQTVDDEDEENDADFELEIEEALESDTDERTDEKEKDEAGRRPETRQNRRKKIAPGKDSGLFQNVQRPLRPIVPLIPSAPISLLATMDRTSTRESLPFAPENSLTSGFTPHQLGQLHCIIYEHVQLLIQVFSLSIFDPARQQIASQAQGLLLEFIDKRNKALAMRSEPHPYFCFRPPFVHPSVSCELPETWPIQFSSVQSPSLDSIGQLVASHSSRVVFTDERPNNEGQEDASRKKERALWLPLMNGPLYSILDVTPLRLAGDYIHDVKIAMKEYQQRYLKDTCDTKFERESMFPSFLDPNVDCIDATTSRVSSCSEGSSSLPSQKTSRKSFAAELIENSKKQPVALVPRVLGKLAQRFFSIFNPALYPRKPPPVVIANRVLFTSAEDELLALGMMEYNTDWKAIQQRFLPCKSKHQIFVRQKNCCSSKAPDNPIKSVRRMKTSPLTVDEVARIREGLKIYKLDWFSIWKFIVPYRDPSLLARQWRIALGIQKSYKSDSANKERRRQYEAHRRRTKAEMAESQILAEKRDNSHSADDSIENEDEAFVHEAFLADWRPHADASVSPQVQAYLSNQSGTQLPVNYLGNIQNGPVAHKVNCYITPDAMNLKSPISGASAISKSTFCSRPYRARRSRRAQMVKLAPDLPALNLPPSVRVMSQSAFKSYHPVASAKVPTSGSVGAPNVTLVRPSFRAFGASFSHMGLPNHNTSSGKTVTNSREDSGEADLEMHPLLFQSLSDGSGLPYHPLKFTSGTSSSFSFFNANQSQTCGSLFRKDQDSVTGSLFSESKAVEITSAPCGIDFHPLLRRDDGAECSTRAALPSVQPSISSELMNELGAGNNISLCERASELNLEIQLCSSPKEHQFRMVNEGTGDMRSAFASTITSKGTRNLPSAPAGNYPLPFFLDSNPNACTYRTDLAGDQSLDIVMEREELSDSDEEDHEIEENVEFEREEMTDSEPDVESDIEAVAVTPKKEVNSGRYNFTVTAEEQAIINDRDFHPCLTLNLACQDQDSQMSNGKNRATDYPAPCQSNKIRRKKTTVRKRTRGAAKTPSSVPVALGSSIEAHPKKPRKRVCKSKLSIDPSATGGSELVEIDKQT